MSRLTTCLIIAALTPLAFGQTAPDDKSGKDAPVGVKSAAPKQTAPARPASADDMLRIRIIEIKFEQAPLSDVLTYLGQIAGVNIVVRWQLLEELGIERDQPVSLSASNLRLRQVLWLLMNDIAGPDVKLAYRAEENLILLSTAEDLNSTMILKAYDVQDLIAARLKSASFGQMRGREIPISNVPTVAAGAVANRPITRRYGSGVYLGGTEPEADSNSREEMDGTPEEHMRQLIDVITNSIEPDSWAANGGAGTIVPFRGMLIVRNSPLVHQKLSGPVSSTATP